MQMTMSFGDYGTPSPHKLVLALAGRYVHHIGELHPVQAHGESVQAFNKRKAHGQGMKEAFGICFETAIGYARVTRYGASIDPVPVLPAFQVEQELFKTIEQVWNEALGTGTGKKKNGTTTWEEFMEGVVPFVQDYVFPADLEDVFMKARQRDILTGKIAPTDEDKSWLSSKADELEAQAANIRSMVQ